MNLTVMAPCSDPMYRVGTYLRYGTYGTTYGTVGTSKYLLRYGTVPQYMVGRTKSLHHLASPE